MSSAQQDNSSNPGFFRKAFSLLLMVAIVVAASLALRTFVVEPYEIPSSSMEETIMTGDKVFAEKVSYRFGSVQRGDIITFDDPQLPSRTLIKRCIAVGGQTVDLQDEKVVVDGVALEESYTEGKPSLPLVTTAPGVDIEYPYTVPVGSLWVMGDNRTNSADSRYFGAISESTVTGKAIIKYWPITSISTL